MRPWAWSPIPQAFEHAVDYPHPAATVWRALTQPEPMGLWIMNFDNDVGEMTTDFRPVVGASYRIEARKGRGWRGFVVGQVLEVVPEQRLVISWAHSATQDAHPVRIEFTLEPTATETRLRVAQSGFIGVQGWFARLGMKMGWTKMLDSGLPVVLAGLASEPGPSKLQG